MDNDSPLVSIIVRTKDRPRLLRRALESIAAQTYRPIEVILVNGGGCELTLASSDETPSFDGAAQLESVKTKRSK